MVNVLWQPKSRPRWAAVGAVIAAVATVSVAPDAHASEPGEARPSLPPTAEVSTDQFGNWSMVGAAPDGALSPDAPGADPIRTAAELLDEFRPGLGVTDPGVAFVPRSSRATGDGGTVVRFDQTVDGVPVFASGVAVRLNTDNAALSVSSSVVPSDRTVGIDLTPTVDQTRAIELARAAIPRDDSGHTVDGATLNASTPTAMVYDADLIGGDPNAATFNGPRLVWSLNLTNEDLGLDYRFLVDAVEPSVLLAFSEVPHATVRQVCDNENSPSQKTCRTEGDAPVAGYAELNQAYDIMGQSYDYFRTNFDRDSFNDAGGSIQVFTRFCFEYGTCPYYNAFWNGNWFSFGQGFANADDVIAHEFTHAVTQYEADLMYYAESGAINESMSDVFGEFIDQSYDLLGTDSPSTKWHIGEDLPNGGLLRNMADPPAVDDPDRMLSPEYHLNVGDNFGIHSNSGVNNKAAFLLADGGNFNGRNVAALGNTKTAAIYYEALTSILTPGSDYLDLYWGLQRACDNLIGTKGITSGDCTMVKRAVSATEMHRAPARRLTASKDCSQGSRTDVFVDDAESGFGRWVSSDDDGRWSVTRRASQSGNQSFFSPGQSGYEYDGPVFSNWMRTKGRVKVPWTGTSYLWFDHSFRLDTAPNARGVLTNWDGAVVEYSLDGRQWSDIGVQAESNGYNGVVGAESRSPIAGRRAFTDMSRGFRQTRISLASLRGKKVFLRFRIGSDALGAADGWYVDDVTVFNCSGVTADFSSGYQPITPTRLIDTRSDAGLVAANGIRPAGSTLRFNARSLPIYADGHTPTALNMTVSTVLNAGPGHVTVYPCGERPTISTLNATSADLIVVNTATVPISSTGEMCIYNHAATHLIIDVAGYQTSTLGSSPPSRYQPLTPRRLIDTRNSTGLVPVEGRRTAGSVLEVDIANLGIFKANTTPRALDVTISAANNDGRGHVTAYPCGDRPNTTVLNTYRPNQVVSNTATIPVSSDDTLCIYTHTVTDLIVDISGYYSPTQGPTLSTYEPINPQRVLDTRNDDGLFPNIGKRPAGSTMRIALDDLGIQQDGENPTAYDLTFAMILNESFGHITVYPCEAERPTAATMTAAEPNMVIANTATIPVSENGEICVYTNPRTHLTVDVTGYHFT